MKCQNCGFECNENQKFCSECGHKIEPVETVFENESIEDIAVKEQTPKFKHKKLVIICSLLVVAIFSASIFSYYLIFNNNNKSKISIEFTENMFNSDIKKAWEFSINEKYIISYYNSLIEAYNKSNGIKCKTFKLPKEFNLADNMLNGYAMDLKNISSYMTKADYSKLIISKQLLNTKSAVAAINLVKTVNPNAGEKELKELRESILDAYVTFTSPVDYSKSKIPVY